MQNANGATIAVGQHVLFGRQNGEKTLGEIVKVNQKNVKVKTLESRGQRRSYAVGSVWSVPKSLIFPASDMGVGERGVGKSFTANPNISDLLTQAEEAARQSGNHGLALGIRGLIEKHGVNA